MTYKKKTPAYKAAMRDRLQVGINELRRDVGWDWALTNEHCLEVFGAISQDMTIEQLYRFFKDLYGLRSFQRWKLQRVGTSFPSASCTVDVSCPS